MKIDQGTALASGTELIPGHLYRYRLVDRAARSVDLHVYAGLAGVAGLLWELEVRMLLRLDGSGLTALPEILDGGYEDEDATRRAGVSTPGIARAHSRAGGRPAGHRP
jgi:hypothetical protein